MSLRFSPLSSLALVMTCAVLLTACGGNTQTPTCVLCYEDEWSREPFPGQPKQHIKALTPEDLKKGTAPIGAREFLGQTSGEDVLPY